MHCTSAQATTATCISTKTCTLSNELSALYATTRCSQHTRGNCPRIFTGFAIPGFHSYVCRVTRVLYLEPAFWAVMMESRTNPLAA